MKKVRRAPGQALSDLNIFRLIAHYWGCGDLFARWTSAEEVFQILKECTRGQPCDFTGIENYQMLDELGGVQWPMSEPSKPETERRLFEDGRFFHADERARFVFDEPREMPEPPCAEYPLLLLTGRGTSSQWHTQTRTAKCGVLRKLYPAGIYAEINPEDAADHGIAPGGRVRVSSRRGSLEAAAVITPVVQPGQVFVPMHYAKTNLLTYPCVDPFSRQPAYKACAVKIAATEIQTS